MTSLSTSKKPCVLRLIPEPAPALRRSTSAAKASGFLLTALSNAHHLALLVSALSREDARPIKHLRYSNGQSMAGFGTCEFCHLTSCRGA